MTHALQKLPAIGCGYDTSQSCNNTRPGEFVEVLVCWDVLSEVRDNKIRSSACCDTGHCIMCEVRCLSDVNDTRTSQLRYIICLRIVLVIALGDILELTE